MTETELKVSEPIKLQSPWGQMQVQHAAGLGQEGVAISFSSSYAEPTLVRIQSSCLFSESLGSSDCDCNSQLKRSLELTADSAGLVVYVLEEGRGAGLRTKFEAIRLQQKFGVNTAVAFDKLGLPPDPRDFQFPASVIRAVLGDRPIELLTNNPQKAVSIQAAGIELVRTRRLLTADTQTVKQYLTEKAQALGHEINEP